MLEEYGLYRGKEEWNMLVVSRRVMWGTKNNIIRKLGSGRVASQI